MSGDELVGEIISIIVEIVDEPPSIDPFQFRIDASSFDELRIVINSDATCCADAAGGTVEVTQQTDDLISPQLVFRFFLSIVRS